MPYTMKIENEEKIAKVYGKELRIKPKYAIELCREIKGMRLDKARKYIQEIIEFKRALPLRRFKKGVAHRSQISGWYAGRFPVKVCKAFLKLLDQVEANAEYKGLDTEKLYIKHACAYKGRTMVRYLPRAFGRATRINKRTTNVEIIVEER